MGKDHTQGGMSVAQRWVLALTSVASFMVSLDSLVVATALPTIRLDLRASVPQLEWTVNAYNLAFAVLLMTGAALGDRFGRRRLFAAGLALFGAASAACALAPEIGWLIAARVVQGAGAALIMPLAMAQLSVAFPPHQRARALGIFSGLTGLAVLGGPVVGGAIAEGLTWQWIFWVNVPIAFVTIALVLRRISESSGPGGAFDVGGILLVTGAASGVVWGLVRGNEIGWGSLEVVATLTVGILLGLAFVAWELYTATPMLPMRLFRSRAFSAGNVVGFCLFGSLYGFVFFTAQFLQAGHGYSPLEAGLRLLPANAMLFLLAPIAGARVNRLGERALIVGGLLLETIGLVWLALVAEPNVPYVDLIAPLVLCGAGISIAMPAAQSAVMGAVAPAEMGKASGTFNMLRFLGGAFGIAILVAVFTGAGRYGTPSAFSEGFAPAIGAAAALAFAGAIAGSVVPAKRGALNRSPLMSAAEGAGS